MPPAQWSYNPRLKDAPRDPAAAKALLAQAGFPNGFDLTLWAMPVQRPYNPNAQLMAQLIQQDWAKIGVRAKIVSYEWANTTAARSTTGSTTRSCTAGRATTATPTTGSARCSVATRCTAAISRSGATGISRSWWTRRVPMGMSRSARRCTSRRRSCSGPGAVHADRDVDRVAAGVQARAWADVLAARRASLRRGVAGLTGGPRGQVFSSARCDEGKGRRDAARAGYRQSGSVQLSATAAAASTGEPSSATDGRPSADRHVADERRAIQLAIEVEIEDVDGREVGGRAVVPERDAARLPLEADREFRPRHVFPQQFEQRLALARRQPDDRFQEARPRTTRVRRSPDARARADAR